MNRSEDLAFSGQYGNDRVVFAGVYFEGSAALPFRFGGVEVQDSLAKSIYNYVCLTAVGRFSINIAQRLTLEREANVGARQVAIRCSMRMCQGPYSVSDPGAVKYNGGVEVIVCVGMDQHEPVVRPIEHIVVTARVDLDVVLSPYGHARHL